MRWYEYKMEVDDVHAPDDLKEKLLAMQKARQAEQAASGTTPKPQLTPAPAPEKKKKAPLRFPVKRAAELAACVALCGVCPCGRFCGLWRDYRSFRAKDRGNFRLSLRLDGW